MKMKQLIFSLMAVIIIFTTIISYSTGVHEDLSQNILRLHILANSDSAVDQKLKLAVRDRILSESRKMFADSSSLEESKAILSDKKDVLIEAAEDEIKKHGFSYSVNINTGVYNFPMKTYEKYSLPSGKYEAVRVEIGKATGQNWWCVMFPPLCFVDAASDTKKTDDYLKKALRDDEISLITTEEGFDVRFKIVDIIESSVTGIRTALNH